MSNVQYSQLYLREEEYFQCNPLNIIDRLADSAEKHTILALRHFTEAIRKYHQTTSSISSSSSSSTNQDTTNPTKYQAIDRIASILTNSRAVNFDKLELFSLNFVFKITLPIYRLICLQSLHKTYPSPRTSSSIRNASLLDASDRRDLELIASVDANALQAQLQTLREKVLAEQQRRKILRTTHNQIAATMAALQPVLRQQSVSSLNETAVLIQAFTILRSRVHKLVEIEQNTRLALRNSQLDPKAVSLPTPSTNAPSSARLSLSCTEPSIHQFQSASTIFNPPNQIGSIRQLLNSSHETLKNSSFIAQQEEVKLPRNTISAPMQMRFEQLVASFERHHQIIDGNDLAQLLSLVSL